MNRNLDSPAVVRLSVTRGLVSGFSEYDLVGDGVNAEKWGQYCGFQFSGLI